MHRLIINLFKKIHWKNTEKYNILQPVSPYSISTQGEKSGSISFRLDNNVEMKYKSQADTSGKSAKIKILDRLNFNTSYNIFRDSIKWAPVSVSAGTSIGQIISLNFSTSYSMYDINERGIEIDKFLFESNKKPFRMQNANLTVGPVLNQKQMLKAESYHKPITCTILIMDMNMSILMCPGV